jgi:hypothetical protein
LYAIGVVGIMLSLGWGGGTYAWASGQVIGLLVVGVLAIIAFILYGRPVLSFLEKFAWKSPC